MSRVYGGVVTAVRTLDAQTANVTGNITFPQGGDILGAGLIECNIISATNISGDLNPINETLTNTTLSGFTNIIGGDLTFLTGNDILGVNDITATGDISADGFLRVGGNIVGDASGSVAGNFYATNIQASNEITCDTLTYNTLNPPVSTSLGLGQILQNSNDASGFDISNVGDIIAHTNADFHIRNNSTNGDMLLQTVRDMDISAGNEMAINSVGLTINSTELDCVADDVVFSSETFEVNTICGILLSSDLPQPAYGVQIIADPLTSFGRIYIQAGQPGGEVVINSDKITLDKTNTLLSAPVGVLAGYTLRSVYTGNAGDFVSSATQMNNLNIEGGYRDSLNWMYMIGRNSVGGTVSYGRIAINKAYFFTGQHPIIVPSHDLSSNHFGLIMSSDVNSHGFIQPPVINDAHIVAKISDKAKDKNVYGVLSYYDFTIQTSYDCDIPTENPEGKIYYANSTGEGMIYVSDIGGSLESGDYITSSNIPGLGMKQDDDLLHSYTMAKSVGDVDFNEHYYTYWKYDDPTNPDRTLSDIHKEIAPKYKVLYGKIQADKYVVYSDIAKTEEHFKVDYDFAGKKPELVGLDFKCALVSCVYQN